MILSRVIRVAGACALVACSSSSLPPATGTQGTFHGGGGGGGGDDASISADAGSHDAGTTIPMDGGVPGFSTTAGSASCNLTATGALTATNVSCLVDPVFDGQKLRFNFLSGTYTFIADMGSNDTLVAGTYTGSTIPDFSSNISGPNLAVWGASLHNVLQDDQGSFTLMLTSPGTPESAGPDGTAWLNPHGSFDETMLPLDHDATGSITVHIDF